MKLTKQRQKETGAFYTPKRWADLAVEYIQKALIDEYSDISPNLWDYWFWDMAAGEGALLDALPDYCDKIASTLEWGDCLHLMREKDYPSFRFDFLYGNLELLTFLEKIPKHRLIVFTNPPYVNLPASHNSPAKTQYGTNDSVLLFHNRILNEIQPLMLCSFNKSDLYQPGENMFSRVADLEYHERTINGFITSSRTWGLSGAFPIVFECLHGLYYDMGLAGGDPFGKDGYCKVTFPIYSDDPNDPKEDTLLRLGCKYKPYFPPEKKLPPSPTTETLF
jgi:hypothetical protein